MTLLIDPPNAPGHGRLWSHLASDTSYAELHVFAGSLGVPVGGFDGDHYDVPAEWYDRAVALGAVPVTSRELIDRLTAAGLRRRKSERLRPRRPGRPLLPPRRLRAGDRVAVVAPAGPVSTEALGAGLDVLRGWGLEVAGEGSPGGPPVGGPAAPRWLAGPDSDRAQALAAAWTDERAAAVWAARGGFGSHRVLDRLDWRGLAASEPKLLVGYSDVTALHQAFATRLGVITVHAPGVATLPAITEEARSAVRALVMEGTAPAVTGRPGVPGVAEGVLVGGNLTVLAAGVGTPLQQPAAASIAVLEDVNEAPYRLDRALTQLLRAGWFAGVRGVLCAAFTGCGEPRVIRDLLVDRLTPLGVPTVYDAPVGHEPDTRPVPLGAVGRLDGSVGTLTFTGPVLR